MSNSDEVAALRAALLNALDTISVAQGMLSAPVPRPLAVRDELDGAIINISEVLNYGNTDD